MAISAVYVSLCDTVQRTYRLSNTMRALTNEDKSGETIINIC